MSSIVRIEGMHDYFDRFSTMLGGRMSDSHPDEQQTQLPPQLGQGTITRIPIRAGMEVVITDMVLERDLQVQIEATYGLFELNYCMEGEIYCAWDGQEHHTGRHGGNVFNMDQIQLYMEKKGGMPIRTVEVRLSPAELLRYVRGTPDQPVVEALLQRTRGRIRPYADSPLVQACVRDLFQCTGWRSMKRLYAESKAMELIALIAQEGEGERDTGGSLIALSADDRERLEEARSLVLSRLEQPLSIPELARQVGINEYKLKRGFRELFGQTVFELVRQGRMEKALELMELDGMNVSETAVQVGYSNMSNFTSAFRRHYGLNPGAYIKQLSRRGVSLRRP
ncbi:AraC family transcriptional regulator [Paenibacillus filicis]|uniref:AraC family transcriptional regulator n=1 Tax=Paenibacillus filicis TaxID=669464 RepID=A0ABU9DSE8_9BACL